MRRFALAVLASLAIFVAPIAHAEDRIVVFAAASLKTALDAVATKYHAGGGRETFLPVRELARPTKWTALRSACLDQGSYRRRISGGTEG